MIHYEQKEECCGCGACVNVCPKQCIEMLPDHEGFIYPTVNRDICVNCGFCEKVCPIEKTAGQMELNRGIIPKTYAMYNKSEEVRRNSSSGGIFTLLAEWVLEKNGVVFGAAMTDDCRIVKHVSIETVEELDLLRGSKYLQSEIGNSYWKVKENLNKGRMVLFTGTPCQIEGLKYFLGREFDTLICMDIICHGVPSPKVWDKYVNFREQCAGTSVQRVFFRNKKYGWKKYSVLFNFSNNTEYLNSFSEDIYMKAFLENICLRPSCYNCQFKQVNRVSDLTVADFWGIENVLPEMDDEMGTSLVMVHSKKGREY